MTAYAELQVTSNFSFLRGASHPDELVARAAAYILQEMENIILCALILTAKIVPSFSLNECP